MSWKCDICDSYNEERSRLCYVCRQARSAESIKEGKLKKREDRVAHINAFFVNRATGVLSLFFILGSACSLVAVIVALIIKTFGGGLDTIWQSAKCVVERMLYNFNALLVGNLRTVISQCSSSLMEQLSADAKVIWSVISNNGSHNKWVIFTVLPDFAEANLQKCYFNRVVPIENRISEHVDRFCMVASGLMTNVSSSIGNLSETIKGLFKTVTNSFN